MITRYPQSLSELLKIAIVIKTIIKKFKTTLKATFRID